MNSKNIKCSLCNNSEHYCSVLTFYDRTGWTVNTTFWIEKGGFIKNVTKEYFCKKCKK